MRSIALGLAAMLAAAAPVFAEIDKKDVDLKASDGLNLRGTFFTSSTALTSSPGGRPGPAMLLLHQCNMDRHAWDGLAGDLANAGIHVLTMDFRGFGDSSGDRVPFQ